jgi:hypothetical protein
VDLGSLTFERRRNDTKDTDIANVLDSPANVAVPAGFCRSAAAQRFIRNVGLNHKMEDVLEMRSTV